MRKRTMFLIGVGSALLLAVVVVFFLRGSDSGDPSGSGGDAPHAGAPGNDPVGGLPSVGQDPDDEPLNSRKVRLRQAGEYRKRARWPGYSHPITKTSDPITNDFTPRRGRAHDPQNPRGPFLIHYPARMSHEPNQPLIMHAMLVDARGRRLKLQGAKAFLTMGGMGGRVLDSKPFKDGGGTGDKANDLLYTVAFRLPANLRKADAPPRNYTVVLKVDSGRAEISATNSFNVGFLNIRHTGKFTDRLASDLRGAHLYIDAEFQVKRRGIYHVQASLYTRGGEALGWAQARRRLAPGKQIVSLRFYGNVLCESGKAGPYVVRHLGYANTGRMPGPRSNKIENVHETKPYRARDFTCKAFNDPSFLDRARHLEK